MIGVFNSKVKGMGKVGGGSYNIGGGTKSIGYGDGISTGWGDGVSDDTWVISPDWDV